MAKTCTLEDLQLHAGDLINEVQHTKQPIYVSLDGWAPVMIVDADQYLNEHQAYLEMRRIFVETIPGVPLPEVSRQAQSTAAIDHNAVNLNEPYDEPLFPTTTESRQNSIFYTNLADNGNPIEEETEILEDTENPVM